MLLVQAFAIVEESSIAKGVRRIVGVTKNGAVEALEAGSGLRNRFTEARGLGIAALEAALPKLKEDLDAFEIPVVLKAELRAAHAELGNKVFSFHKRAAAAAEEGVLKAVGDGVAAAGAGAKFVLLDVAAQDPKVLMRAITTVPADVTVLLLGSIDGRGGAGTLVGVARVSAADQAKGLKANEWVNATLAPSGGKGGGKPDTAQAQAREAKNVAECRAAGVAMGKRLLG